jgi:hypothetical protein
MKYRLLNVYFVSQKFSTAISKGLVCVDPSSMIFRDINNCLPVNTSQYTTPARFYSFNKLLSLHGVASNYRDKFIFYLYIRTLPLLYSLLHN